VGEKKEEPKVYEQELTADAVRVSATLSTSVTRGLNELRLAVLGILVTIGLSVGFGLTSCAWWIRVAAGLAAFWVSVGLIHWPWSQDKLMKFVYWVIRS
jgi:hypothetical protein